MRNRPDPNDVNVLVLGDAKVGRRLADSLRLRGVSSWLASSPETLRWLMGKGGARPSVALVMLPQETSDRDARVDRLRELVSMTNMPAVVVGADDRELARFRGAVAALAGEASLDQILQAIATISESSAPVRSATGS